MTTERMACPCCFETELEIRFDKHGRPYCTCGACSARIFPRGMQSLVNLAILSPLASAMAERIATDREEWERAQATRIRVEASLRPTTRTESLPTTAVATATAESLSALAAGGAR